MVVKLKKQKSVEQFTKEDVDAAEKNLPNYYSVSQLNQSNRCRRQRYFRYVCGLKILPNFNLIGGSAVHSGAEHTLRKKQNHKSTSLDTQLDAATDKFKKAWSGQAHVIEETKGQCVDVIAALTEVWYKEIQPDRVPIFKKTIKKINLQRVDSKRTIKFTGIEQEFWLPLPGLGKYILGFIDFFDSMGWVIDLKTTGKDKNENELRSHQLSTYVMAAKRLGWPKVRRIALDVVIKPQKKKPKRFTHVLSKKTPTKTELIHTIDSFRGMEALDDAGQFPPQYSNDCSWCGYKAVCDKVGSVSYHV